METHIDIHQLIDAKKLVQRGYSNEAIQNTLMAALAKQVSAIWNPRSQKPVSDEDMADFEQGIARLTPRLAESGFIMETERHIEHSLFFKVKESKSSKRHGKKIPGQAERTSYTSAPNRPPCASNCKNFPRPILPCKLSGRFLTGKKN